MVHILVKVSFYISTTWWVSLLVTSESTRTHVVKFYGRLRLIRSVLRASKFTVLKFNEIIIIMLIQQFLCQLSIDLKRKRRRSDPVLWQKPPIPTENSKTKGQHTQTPPKTSITQRLRTDLGRSVGVTSNPTGVVKPVYGIPTFPLTAKAV